MNEMTEYKVKSRIRPENIVSHKYFKNGEEDESLNNFSRIRDIAEFHEINLRSDLVPSELSTKIRIKK